MRKTLLTEAGTLVVVLAIFLLMPVILGVEGLPLPMFIVVIVVWVVVTAARLWFKQRPKPGQ